MKKVTKDSRGYLLFEITIWIPVVILALASIYNIIALIQANHIQSTFYNQAYIDCYTVDKAILSKMTRSLNEFSINEGVVYINEIGFYSEEGFIYRKEAEKSRVRLARGDLHFSIKEGDLSDLLDIRIVMSSRGQSFEFERSYSALYTHRGGESDQFE